LLSGRIVQTYCTILLFYFTLLDRNVYKLLSAYLVVLTLHSIHLPVGGGDLEDIICLHL